MTKIVEVKDSAVGSICVHLTDEGENMENNICGYGDGDVDGDGMSSIDHCCCRPPMPVSDVGELYKSLKSGIQSARERIGRRPDWNIKKKDKNDYR